ncbi:MAG: hypothetical protein AABW90_01660 [Nanoarchaeota archaeon]
MKNSLITHNKTLFLIITILLLLFILLVTFFPKYCGGVDGIGGPVTSIDCSCVGIKGQSLFELLGGRITDASETSCSGFCLKSTCKTTISFDDKIGVGICVTNADCVPAICCHPSACVPINEKPDCDDVFCTQECALGTLDCNQGYCGCINQKCQAVF